MGGRSYETESSIDNKNTLAFASNLSRNGSKRRQEHATVGCTVVRGITVAVLHARSKVVYITSNCQPWHGTDL